MVASSMIGGQRPLYGGVYTVGEYGKGVYFPNMGGYIICRLKPMKLSLVGSFCLSP
jgi:hypothetical protein